MVKNRAGETHRGLWLSGGSHTGTHGDTLTFTAAAAPSSAWTFISTGKTSSQAGLEVSEEEAAKSDRHPWRADVCAGGSVARMWGPREPSLLPECAGRWTHRCSSLRWAVTLRKFREVCPEPPGSSCRGCRHGSPGHLGQSRFGVGATTPATVTVPRARATPPRVHGLRVPAGWCASSLVPRASYTEQTPSNPLRMGSEPENSCSRK